MDDAYLIYLAVAGGLGALAAFVERRDGWRYAALAREVADVRERVALLERNAEQATDKPSPRPWWAFWGQP
jgi:hypothetical protein